MNIYLYTRVSTGDKQQTTANQIPELLAYSNRMGWPTPTILEEKVSATKTRPVFESLLQKVRAGKVDVILAWKLDRIARSLSQFVEFYQELTKHKTRLIIPSQGLDTDASTPAGRLQQHILMAFAEFERELIRDRVKAGLERAKAEGRELGRKRVVVNRELLARLKAGGRSYRRIADETGLSLGKVQREIAAYEKSNNVGG